MFLSSRPDPGRNVSGWPATLKPADSYSRRAGESLQVIPSSNPSARSRAHAIA